MASHAYRKEPSFQRFIQARAERLRKRGSLAVDLRFKLLLSVASAVAMRRLSVLFSAVLAETTLDCAEIRGHNLRKLCGDKMYIWEQPKWPTFSWNQDVISTPLAQARHEQGLLLGRMQALGFALQKEATLKVLTEDVIKTSEIEGEKLDRDQVKSSIARHLGMEVAGLVPSERNVDGIVEVMLDATNKSSHALTQQRLFDWHAALFPTGRNGMHKIRVGNWRDDSTGPMQVVSGPMGREKVHFTAPPANRVPAEIERFLKWFNKDTDSDPLQTSSIAHLWFVTIHPFDDGNGRIARALADMILARYERTSQRFYSVSSQIRRQRTEYYEILEETQEGALDITDWIEWFLQCFTQAVANSQETLESTLAKARFWERFAGAAFNERQRKVLNRLLDGFEGNLTSSKWARMTKCSQDTASRDIAALVHSGVLKRGTAKGRSTSYLLADL